MDLKLTELKHEDKSIEELVKEVISTKFNHLTPLPPEPEYAITIDGKGIVEKGGSLIGIYGLPKTRKSSLVAMVIAAALSEDKTFGKIDAHGVDGNILWFDTEMGLNRELPRFHNHIIDMADRRGEAHDEYLLSRYHVFNLRKYNHIERLSIIDYIVTDKELSSNVGMMVLDGVADIVGNSNELGEAKEIVDRLLMWADTLNCPLFVALHLTHSTKKPTGYLGNYLMNKSSYNIVSEVEFDGAPSIIKPMMTRNGNRFEPFLITNVESGKPNSGQPRFYDSDDEAIEYQPNFIKPQRSIEIDNLFG